MKSFLTRLFIFFILPLILFAIAFNVKSWLAKQRASTLEPSIDKLLLGDSRFAGGLDDKMIPNSKNISKPGEHYMVAYYKFRYFTQKETVKAVVISLSYSNLSYSMDYKLSNYPQYADECAEVLYPILGLKMYSVPIDYMTVSKVIFRNTVTPGISTIDRCYEGFHSKPDTVDTSASVDPIIQKHFYIGQSGDKISPLQVQYLDSMALLAERRNLQLLVVSPPLHQVYLDKIPAPIKSKFDSVTNLLRHYPNTSFIDLSQTMAGAQFFDFDHLNTSGAELLSDTVRQIIQAKIR